eukprot:1190125-Prorocentrum_minimum.AAC.1
MTSGSCGDLGHLAELLRERYGALHLLPADGHHRITCQRSDTMVVIKSTRLVWSVCLVNESVMLSRNKQTNNWIIVKIK